MKDVMKCKMLLAAILCGLATAAFAQGADICTSESYTIANTVSASAGSTYQWVENGQVIVGASAATYVVRNKAAGLYTYVRRAKSAECSEWQPSNEFTVTVFNCAFTAGSTPGSATKNYTDPRDGKIYKTVVMPDGRTWFAQNLNYTKGLVANATAAVANGRPAATTGNGAPAIGSYWCPGLDGQKTSGDEKTCEVYGALYTWETAMMVDGKYADESKSSSVWEESWMAGNYLSSGAPNSANAKINKARGGRGICPKGWHVPTEYEWAVMLDAVDGSTTFTNQANFGHNPGTSAIGAKLMHAATYTGSNPMDGSWEARSGFTPTNQTGFDALPSGDRSSITFSRLGSMTTFLGQSVAHSAGMHMYTFTNKYSGAYRNSGVRWAGYSVRCIKD